MPCAPVPADRDACEPNLRWFCRLILTGSAARSACPADPGSHPRSTPSTPDTYPGRTDDTPTVAETFGSQSGFLLKTDGILIQVVAPVEDLGHWLLVLGLCQCVLQELVMAGGNVDGQRHLRQQAEGAVLDLLRSVGSQGPGRSPRTAFRKSRTAQIWPANLAPNPDRRSASREAMPSK